MMRVVDDWASRISWRWGVTGIAALVTTLVVVLLLVLLPRGGPAATASATTGTRTVPPLPSSSVTGTPSAASPVTASPLASSTPSLTAPPPTTSDDLPAATTPPASGPGVTEPGIAVSVSPQMDGSLEVLETAIYRAPVEAVRLDPVDVRDGGPSFGALVPTVTHLQMTADGSPVGMLLSVTEATTVPLPTGARQVVLRYHLDGVTVRSTPSTAGRASILIAPLSAPTDAGLPSQIRVGGRFVLNLTCPRRSGDARACAPATGDSGVAPILAARDDVVVAQVDLPAPS